MIKKIKMRRNYKPHYRIGWMEKGSTYDVEIVGISQEKAKSLIDTGYAELAQENAVVAQVSIPLTLRKSKARLTDEELKETASKVRESARARRAAREE